MYFETYKSLQNLELERARPDERPGFDMSIEAGLLTVLPFFFLLTLDVLLDTKPLMVFLFHYLVVALLITHLCQSCLYSRQGKCIFLLRIYFSPQLASQYCGMDYLVHVPMDGTHRLSRD